MVEICLANLNSEGTPWFHPPPQPLAPPCPTPKAPPSPNRPDPLLATVTSLPHSLAAGLLLQLITKARIFMYATLGLGLDVRWTLVNTLTHQNGIELQLGPLVLSQAACLLHDLWG